jgi:hypothetical protein
VAVDNEDMVFVFNVERIRLEDSATHRPSLILRYVRR